MSATTVQSEKPEVQIHQLTATASDEEIRQILGLSLTVFPPTDDTPTHHTSFDYWREQLSIPNAQILFATKHSSSQPGSGKPVGFFFNFPKTQPDLGFEALHIWLAGVLEETRGLGIFPMLMERTARHARACGYQLLTVRTIPGVWTQMWRILRSNGWEVVSESDSVFGTRVLLKLKL